MNRTAYEDRLAIAVALSSLIVGVEINQNPKRYFSLDIGSRPNKNAIIIPKFSQHVSFYLEDLTLIKRLEDAEFKVEPFPEDPRRLFNKHKHKISPMTLSHISEHKTLITEVLNHSLKVIRDRKTKSS